MADVIPKEIINTHTIARIEIISLNVILHSSARASVVLYDLNGVPVMNKDVFISGEEYNNWGLDDDYMLNLIISKIGFEIKR